MAIPTAPKALPLLGHVGPLIRDPLALLRSLPAYGDLVQIRLGPVRLIAVCDPELTLQVLRNDRTFDKGGIFFDRVREVLGNGLGTCPHSDHRRQRRLAQPAFHTARLAGYARAMVPCIAEEAGSWHDGQIIDVRAEMLNIASKALAATLFRGAASTGLGTVVDDTAFLVNSMYHRILMVPPLHRLPTPFNRAYERTRSRLFQNVGRLIAERRAAGDGDGDLMSALLAARDYETAGEGLTDGEITDTVITFVLAGVETTAATLTWALHLLAAHPEAEQRLHSEIDSVLGGEPPRYEDIPRLEFTDRVITETLRMYPPGWFFTRTVTAPTRLGGHALPAGATLLYSPYLTHHRDDLYDSPSTFVPDRWDPRHGRQPSRNALIPFGAGPRKCIGDGFAMTEATLALAAIGARWQLDPLPGQNAQPRLAGVLWPRQSRMRVVARPVRGWLGGRRARQPDR